MSTSALFEAIRAGNFAAVTALLNSEASLASAKNDSGVSAVLMSVYTGRREIRDLLLSRGAALQLHEAVAVGNLDRVRQFVQNDPSAARSFSPDGFPVVALAAVFGHLEVARYLAAQGADVNAPATNGSGYNALTGAVASGHAQIVKWLLETGADANYRYGPGYSPLLTAAANGHLEIVKLLLAHGADLRAVSNDGKSALALATERNHPAVAEHLQSVAV
ncbi:MAG: ankyrin repeat domain-containing protein [Candidatus Acidiferrum sp.]